MRTDLKTGTIRTIIGNGDPGLTGDGGPATLACLNEPKSVTVDGQGNLIVTDSENHLVRKLDRQTGLIRTIAGCRGTPGPGREIMRTPPESGQDDPLSDVVPIEEGAFTQQTDLSGTVRYVVNGAGVAKRFGGDGGPATQAFLNFPTAVVVDRVGHLYIADQMNHRVRRVQTETGRISTLAGVGQPRFGGDGGRP